MHSARIMFMMYRCFPSENALSTQTGAMGSGTLVRASPSVTLRVLC